MLTLASPWALILLPLPLLLWYGLPPAKPFPSQALKIPFFTDLLGLVEQNRLLYPALVPLFFLIWCLLVLALACPRWVGEPIPVHREGQQILLALDLSGSMEINDMVWQGQASSRLNVVKQTAKQFVQTRTKDSLGLILFGTRAYLQTPLTYDRQNVLMRIEDATAGLAGKTTSLGDAVGLAVKHLSLVPPSGRILILLTDGANNSGVLDPLKAAELAKEEGIKIYTIGLGSEADQILNPAFFIPNAAADLDEETLQKMAEMTKGRYFRATDTQTLGLIYKTIDQLEKTKQEPETLRPQIDYYPWLVACALLLLFYWMLKNLLHISPTCRESPTCRGLSAASRDLPHDAAGQAGVRRKGGDL